MKFKRVGKCVLVALFLGVCGMVLGDSAQAAIGRDHSFQKGYHQREFAREFHEMVIETAIEDEEAERAKLFVAETIVRQDLKWSRSLGYQVEYDSNLFNKRGDIKGDLIHSYGGKIGVGRGREGSRAFWNLAYELSYDDYVENDRFSNYNHLYTADFGMKFKKLSISFSDSYRPDSVITIDDRTELAVEDTPNIETITNNAQMRINYRWTPKLELTYTQAYNLYLFPTSSGATSSDISLEPSEVAEGLSYAEHRFTPRISYKFGPKTDIYLEGEFEIVDYIEGGGFSSEEITILGGVQKKLTPKTTLNVDVGLSSRTFDEEGAEEIEGLILKLALSRQITPKLFGTIWLTQDTGENLNSVTATSIKTADRFKLLKEESTFAGVSFTWLCSPHSSVFAAGGVGITDRGEEVTLPDTDNALLEFTRNREEEVYEWKVSWDWQPRPYFNFQIGYQYFNKNASFKDFEYEEQIATISTSMRF